MMPVIFILSCSFLAILMLLWFSVVSTSYRFFRFILYGFFELFCSHLVVYGQSNSVALENLLLDRCRHAPHLTILVWIVLSSFPFVTAIYS